LNWSIFNLETTNLSRFDFCYDRELKRNNSELNSFLLSSYNKVNSGTTNQVAKVLNNILWVGKRSSLIFFEFI